jgi:hypothetical protein
MNSILSNPKIVFIVNIVSSCFKNRIPTARKTPKPPAISTFQRLGPQKTLEISTFQNQHLKNPRHFNFSPIEISSARQRLTPMKNKKCSMLIAQ